MTTGAELPATAPAATPPFLDQALEAFRRGEDLCPHCGWNRKPRNEKRGWLHCGGKLSICGTCRKAGLVQPDVTKEDEASWRAAREAVDTAAKAAKPKREGADLPTARFIGEATDLGFLAKQPRPAVVRAKCRAKGCSLEFSFSVADGHLPRTRLQQLRQHASEHQKAPKAKKGRKR